MGYSTEDITEGLRALLVAGGNAKAASEESGVPESTLRTWRAETHAEQYRRLEEAFNLEIIEETKSLARSNAHKASDLERRLLEKVEDSIEKMDGKEAALAAEKVASVKAKSIDKLISLTGLEPGGKREKQDFGDLLASMERKGYIKLRGTAAPAAPEEDE